MFGLGMQELGAMRHSLPVPRSLSSSMLTASKPWLAGRRSSRLRLRTISGSLARICRFQASVTCGPKHAVTPGCRLSMARSVRTAEPRTAGEKKQRHDFSFAAMLR